MCVCLRSISIPVGVTLGLWHWGRTVYWVLEQCCSVLRIYGWK